MKFDLVSDVHIEHWNNNYDFLKSKQSNILVVAGDIADHVDPAVNWLTVVSSEYQHILVVDGNHEHQGERFPLIDIVTELRERFSQLKNVHFLERGPFIKDDVAFVGRCGWWDYRIGEPHVNWETSYNHFSRYMSEQISQDILAQSAQDYADILRECLELQRNESIEKIVCVTHTLPHHRGISWDVYPNKSDAVGCYGNSLMEMVPIYAPKVSTWCFGHNHDAKEFTIHGRNYHSNPRGRPEDFDRIDYAPKLIHV
jgi:hypothetical protein